MTPGEIAIAVLTLVLLGLAITASLVNMAIALTEMIERWRETEGAMTWWRTQWFRDALWMGGMGFAASVSGIVLGVLQGAWAGLWVGIVVGVSSTIGAKLQRERTEREKG